MDHPRYESVLSTLRKLKWHPGCKMWSACCPAHEDRHPSLLVWVGRSGNLLARCKSGGCSWAAIVEATGTNKKDWFPEMNEQETQQVKRKVVAVYPYRDPLGKVLYECCRIEPGRNGRCKDFSYRRPQPDGKGWVWNLEGVDRVLYRLPELLDPKRKDEIVWIPEGEGKCDCLAELGLLATTNPCGANAWEFEYGASLRGRRVVILPDSDEVGRQRAASIAGNLVYWNASKVAILNLIGLGEGGDVKDWLEGFKGREEKRAALIDALKVAPKWERK